MIEKLAEMSFRKPPYLLIDKINEIIEEINKLSKKG